MRQRFHALAPLSDGAAGVLLMTATKAKALGLKPLAKFITFATAGVEPDIMGVGPIKAVPKVLKRAGLLLDQIKLIEFNEAFAAQALAVIKELGMVTMCIGGGMGAAGIFEVYAN